MGKEQKYPILVDFGAAQARGRVVSKPGRDGAGRYKLGHFRILAEVYPLGKWQRFNFGAV